MRSGIMGDVHAPRCNLAARDEEIRQPEWSLCERHIWTTYTPCACSICAVHQDTYECGMTTPHKYFTIHYPHVPLRWSHASTTLHGPKNLQNPHRSWVHVTEALLLCFIEERKFSRAGWNFYEDFLSKRTKPNQQHKVTREVILAVWFWVLIK